MPKGFCIKKEKKGCSVQRQKKVKKGSSALRQQKRRKVFIFNEPFRDPDTLKVFQEIGAEGYSRIALTTHIPPKAEEMFKRGFELFRAGPMDFTEFALALGEEDTVHSILAGFAAWKADECLHRKAGTLFADYLAVGGMPAAVEKFVQTRNLTEVRAVQTAVWASWKESVRADAGALADAALEALTDIVCHLSSGACLETSAGDKRLEALKWLSKAGYVLEAKHSKGLPKDAAPLPSRWYLADTGVLGAAAEAEGFTKGTTPGGGAGLRRNFTAQVLSASGHPLLYFSNETRTVNFDFMVPFYYRPEIRAYWNSFLNKLRREDVPAPLPLLAPRIQPSDIDSRDFLYVAEKSRNKPAYTAVPLVIDAAFTPDEVRTLFRNHEGVHSGPYVLSDGKPEIREDFVRMPFYMAPFISWVPEEFAKSWNAHLDPVYVSVR
jgi:hypothetical protein